MKLTDEKKKFLRKHYIACNSYASEQEIAVTMVRRINEALEILQGLEVKTPINQVCYHHYNHSVEERNKI